MAAGVTIGKKRPLASGVYVLIFLLWLTQEAQCLSILPKEFVRSDCSVGAVHATAFAYWGSKLSTEPDIFCDIGIEQSLMSDCRLMLSL